MDKNIILSPVPLDDLVAMITAKVAETISQQQQKQQEERLLSPSEACQVFKPAVTRQTIHSWQAAGHLQRHIIGTKVYYKLSELLAAGTTLGKYKKIIKT